MEVNRTVERYSLRKDMAYKLSAQDSYHNFESSSLSPLPESSPALSHMNSSQTQNLVTSSVSPLSPLLKLFDDN